MAHGGTMFLLGVILPLLLLTVPSSALRPDQACHSLKCGPHARCVVRKSECKEKSCPTMVFCAKDPQEEALGASSCSKVICSEGFSCKVKTHKCHQGMCSLATCVPAKIRESLGVCRGHACPKGTFCQEKKCNQPQCQPEPMCVPIRSKLHVTVPSLFRQRTTTGTVSVATISPAPTSVNVTSKGKNSTPPRKKTKAVLPETDETRDMTIAGRGPTTRAPAPRRRERVKGSGLVRTSSEKSTVTQAYRVPSLIDTATEVNRVEPVLVKSVQVHAPNLVHLCGDRLCSPDETCRTVEDCSGKSCKAELRCINKNEVLTSGNNSNHRGNFRSDNKRSSHSQEGKGNLKRQQQRFQLKYSIANNTRYPKARKAFLNSPQRNTISNLAPARNQPTIDEFRKQEENFNNGSKHGQFNYLSSNDSSSLEHNRKENDETLLGYLRVLNKLHDLRHNGKVQGKTSIKELGVREPNSEHEKRPVTDEIENNDNDIPHALPEHLPEAHPKSKVTANFSKDVNKKESEPNRRLSPMSFVVNGYDGQKYIRNDEIEDEITYYRTNIPEPYVQIVPAQKRDEYEIDTDKTTKPYSDTGNRYKPVIQIGRTLVKLTDNVLNASQSSSDRKTKHFLSTEIPLVMGIHKDHTSVYTTEQKGKLKKVTLYPFGRPVYQTVKQLGKESLTLVDDINVPHGISQLSRGQQTKQSISEDISPAKDIQQTTQSFSEDVSPVKDIHGDRESVYITGGKKVNPVPYARNAHKPVIQLGKASLKLFNGINVPHNISQLSRNQRITQSISEDILPVTNVHEDNESVYVTEGKSELKKLTLIPYGRTAYKNIIKLGKASLTLLGDINDPHSVSQLSRDQQTTQSISGDVSSVKDIQQTTQSISEDVSSVKDIQQTTQSISGDISSVKDIQQTTQSISGDISSVKDIQQTTQSISGDVSSVKDIQQTTQSISGDISSVKGIQQTTQSISEDISSVKGIQPTTQSISGDVSSVKGIQTTTQSISEDVSSVKGIQTTTQSISGDISSVKDIPEDHGSVYITEGKSEYKEVNRVPSERNEYKPIIKLGKASLTVADDINVPHSISRFSRDQQTTQSISEDISPVKDIHKVHESVYVTEEKSELKEPFVQLSRASMKQIANEHIIHNGSQELGNGLAKQVHEKSRFHPSVKNNKGVFPNPDQSPLIKGRYKSVMQLGRASLKLLNNKKIINNTSQLFSYGSNKHIDSEDIPKKGINPPSTPKKIHKPGDITDKKDVLKNRNLNSITKDRYKSIKQLGKASLKVANHKQSVKNTHRSASDKKRKQALKKQILKGTFQPPIQHIRKKHEPGNIMKKKGIIKGKYLPSKEKDKYGSVKQLGKLSVKLMHSQNVSQKSNQRSSLVLTKEKSQAIQNQINVHQNEQDILLPVTDNRKQKDSQQGLISNSSKSTEGIISRYKKYRLPKEEMEVLERLLKEKQEMALFYPQLPQLSPLNNESYLHTELQVPQTDNIAYVANSTTEATVPVRGEDKMLTDNAEGSITDKNNVSSTNETTDNKEVSLRNDTSLNKTTDNQNLQELSDIHDILPDIAQDKHSIQKKQGVVYHKTDTGQDASKLLTDHQQTSNFSQDHPTSNNISALSYHKESVEAFKEKLYSNGSDDSYGKTFPKAKHPNETNIWQQNAGPTETVIGENHVAEIQQLKAFKSQNNTNFVADIFPTIHPEQLTTIPGAEFNILQIRTEPHQPLQLISIRDRNIEMHDEHIEKEVETTKEKVPENQYPEQNLKLQSEAISNKNSNIESDFKFDLSKLNKFKEHEWDSNREGLNPVLNMKEDKIPLTNKTSLVPNLDVLTKDNIQEDYLRVPVPRILTNMVGNIEEFTEEPKAARYKQLLMPSESPEDLSQTYKNEDINLTMTITPIYRDIVTSTKQIPLRTQWENYGVTVGIPLTETDNIYKKHINKTESTLTTSPPEIDQSATPYIIITGTELLTSTINLKPLDQHRNTTQNAETNTTTTEIPREKTVGKMENFDVTTNPTTSFNILLGNGSKTRINLASYPMASGDEEAMRMLNNLTHINQTILERSMQVEESTMNGQSEDTKKTRITVPVAKENIENTNFTVYTEDDINYLEQLKRNSIGIEIGKYKDYKSESKPHLGNDKEDLILKSRPESSTDAKLYIQSISSNETQDLITKARRDNSTSDTLELEPTTETRPDIKIENELPSHEAKSKPVHENISDNVRGSEFGKTLTLERDNPNLITEHILQDNYVIRSDNESVLGYGQPDMMNETQLGNATGIKFKQEPHLLKDILNNTNEIESEATTGITSDNGLILTNKPDITKETKYEDSKNSNITNIQIPPEEIPDFKNNIPSRNGTDITLDRRLILTNDKFDVITEIKPEVITQISFTDKPTFPQEMTDIFKDSMSTNITNDILEAELNFTSNKSDLHTEMRAWDITTRKYTQELISSTKMPDFVNEILSDNNSDITFGVLTNKLNLIKEINLEDIKHTNITEKQILPQEIPDFLKDIKSYNTTNIGDESNLKNNKSDLKLQIGQQDNILTNNSDLIKEYKPEIVTHKNFTEKAISRPEIHDFLKVIKSDNITNVKLDYESNFINNKSNLNVEIKLKNTTDNKIESFIKLGDVSNLTYNKPALINAMRTENVTFIEKTNEPHLSEEMPHLVNKLELDITKGITSNKDLNYNYNHEPTPSKTNLSNENGLVNITDIQFTTKETESITEPINETWSEGTKDIKLEDVPVSLITVEPDRINEPVNTARPGEIKDIKLEDVSLIIKELERITEAINEAMPGGIKEIKVEDVALIKKELERITEAINKTMPEGIKDFKLEDVSISLLTMEPDRINEPVNGTRPEEIKDIKLEDVALIIKELERITETINEIKPEGIKDIKLEDVALIKKELGRINEAINKTMPGGIKDIKLKDVSISLLTMEPDRINETVNGTRPGEIKDIKLEDVPLITKEPEKITESINGTTPGGIKDTKLEDVSLFLTENPDVIHGTGHMAVILSPLHSNMNNVTGNGTILDNTLVINTEKEQITSNPGFISNIKTGNVSNAKLIHENRTHNIIDLKVHNDIISMSEISAIKPDVQHRISVNGDINITQEEQPELNRGFESVVQLTPNNEEITEGVSATPDFGGDKATGDILTTDYHEGPLNTGVTNEEGLIKREEGSKVVDDLQQNLFQKDYKPVTADVTPFREENINVFTTMSQELHAERNSSLYDRHDKDLNAPREVGNSSAILSITGNNFIHDIQSTSDSSSTTENLKSSEEVLVTPTLNIFSSNLTNLRASPQALEKEIFSQEEEETIPVSTTSIPKQPLYNDAVLENRPYNYSNYYSHLFKQSPVIYLTPFQKDQGSSYQSVIEDWQKLLDGVPYQTINGKRYYMKQPVLVHFSANMNPSSPPLIQNMNNHGYNIIRKPNLADKIDNSIELLGEATETVNSATRTTPFMFYYSAHLAGPELSPVQKSGMNIERGEMTEKDQVLPVIFIVPQMKESISKLVSNFKTSDQLESVEDIHDTEDELQGNIIEKENRRTVDEMQLSLFNKDKKTPSVYELQEKMTENGNGSNDKEIIKITTQSELLSSKLPAISNGTRVTKPDLANKSQNQNKSFSIPHGMDPILNNMELNQSLSARLPIQRIDLESINTSKNEHLSSKLQNSSSYIKARGELPLRLSDSPIKRLKTDNTEENNGELERKWRRTDEKIKISEKNNENESLSAGKAIITTRHNTTLHKNNIQIKSHTKDVNARKIISHYRKPSKNKYRQRYKRLDESEVQLPDAVQKMIKDKRHSKKFKSKIEGLMLTPKPEIQFYALKIEHKNNFSPRVNPKNADGEISQFSKGHYSKSLDMNTSKTNMSSVKGNVTDGKEVPQKSSDRGREQNNDDKNVFPVSKNGKLNSSALQFTKILDVNSSETNTSSLQGGALLAMTRLKTGTKFQNISLVDNENYSMLKGNATDGKEVPQKSSDRGRGQNNDNKNVFPVSKNGKFNSSALQFTKILGVKSSETNMSSLLQGDAPLAMTRLKNGTEFQNNSLVDNENYSILNGNVTDGKEVSQNSREQNNDDKNVFPVSKNGKLNSSALQFTKILGVNSSETNMSSLQGGVPLAMTRLKNGTEFQNNSLVDNENYSMLKGNVTDRKEFPQNSSERAGEQNNDDDNVFPVSKNRRLNSSALQFTKILGVNSSETNMTSLQGGAPLAMTRLKTGTKFQNISLVDNENYSMLKGNATGGKEVPQNSSERAREQNNDDKNVFPVSKNGKLNSNTLQFTKILGVNSSETNMSSLQGDAPVAMTRLKNGTEFQNISLVDNENYAILNGNVTDGKKVPQNSSDRVREQNNDDNNNNKTFHSQQAYVNSTQTVNETHSEQSPIHPKSNRQKIFLSNSQQFDRKSSDRVDKLRTRKENAGEDENSFIMFLEDSRLPVKPDKNHTTPRVHNKTSETSHPILRYGNFSITKNVSEIGVNDSKDDILLLEKISNWPLNTKGNHTTSHVKNRAVPFQAFPILGTAMEGKTSNKTRDKQDEKDRLKKANQNLSAHVRNRAANFNAAVVNERDEEEQKPSSKSKATRNHRHEIDTKNVKKKRTHWKSIGRRDEEEMEENNEDDQTDHKTENGNDHKTENGDDHKTENGNDHTAEDENDHTTENGNDHVTKNGNDHTTKNGNDHTTKNGNHEENGKTTTERTANCFRKKKTTPKPICLPYPYVNFANPKRKVPAHGINLVAPNNNPSRLVYNSIDLFWPAGSSIDNVETILPPQSFHKPEIVNTIRR